MSDYWTIEYRNIAGSPRSVRIEEDSLMDALAVFNSINAFNSSFRKKRVINFPCCIWIN